MRKVKASIANIILAAIAVGLLFKIGVLAALILSIIVVLKVL